jgi:hypothetical protein
LKDNEICKTTQVPLRRTGRIGIQRSRMECNRIGIGSSEFVQQSTRMRIESVVDTKSHGKFVVEEESEVSL